MKISVGVSNRHIHLCESDYKKLFGDKDFSVKKELSQDGEFASNLTLTIKGCKGSIENVRVIGPLRERTQVEISLTDAYKLGVNPPVRMSNDFNKADDIMLSSELGEVLSKNTCIIANRHIHVNTKEQEKYNLHHGDIVKVRVFGVRGGTLDNVIVKAKDNYNLELHLDTDEANAFALKNGDIVEILEDR